MAGNASILIQEQNSGKRTNFLVFELDGCGQKTGKSRLVSCPVVVRKKDDFVYMFKGIQKRNEKFSVPYFITASAPGYYEFDENIVENGNLIVTIEIKK